MLYLQTSVKSKSDSIGINRFGFDVPTLNKTGIKRENRNTSEIGSDFDYRRIRALYLRCRTLELRFIYTLIYNNVI